MILEGQKIFRSQVSYVSLVAVLIVSALIIVIGNSPPAAAAFAGVGAVWVAATLHSAVQVTEDGFRVRGLIRSRQLRWGETDAFIVVSYSGADRVVLRAPVEYATPTSGGPGVVGISMGAISNEALTARGQMFSVVAAVTSRGECLRVHGTAATPLDPSFSTDAAAELNRLLKQHGAAATAS